MHWLFLPLSLFAAYFLWTGVALLINYTRARQLGLPIIISPINPLNPIWVLSNKRLIPYVEKLPWDLGGFTRYIWIGWSFDDKYHVHEKLGDAFVLVTPGDNEIHICNASTLDEVFSRKDDFPKPTAMYKPLECFGRNVDTVGGKDWQRHRKITTRPFNERNSSLVWIESLRQSQDMLKWWIHHGVKGADSTTEDTVTLALHVLTSAGFGISYSFHHDRTIKPAGHTMSYRDALAIVLADPLVVFLVPHRLLSLRLLPANLRKVGKAIQEYRRYMADMVKRQRLLLTKRDYGTDSLMGALVRASEDAQQTSIIGESSSQGLTDDEIYGNIFIYNLAGHETTANTLGFSILLLAAHPEIQDWLAEEVNHVLGDREGIEEWEYAKAFPRLQRCLALMYESLRLYGPVTAIPKYTETGSQSLLISDRQIVIPRYTFVYCNSIALHCHPRYWGSDSLTWRPTRWMISDNSISSTTYTPNLTSERLMTPTKGSFIPWSEGARVCPGRKFAQVEFVAVMAMLFRNCRVRPALFEGEKPEEARERVLETVRDSKVAVTLQMQHPKRVSLVWTRMRPGAK
ncbi:MAG: hypothetical protein M1827_004268 [Pycnora praestabilis]|nr:MAG: hypothetical protein M1827_004268 [Pycnora praestabilis]